MTDTAINLSDLPFPGVVETLSFETILAEMLADLQARDPAFSALVESDPAYKILEVAAYREVIVRQRVNDAAKAVTLAYATGTDLENLAALFGVSRLTIDEGDPDAVPPEPPEYETDAELRARAQLALEGMSTAGPRGAYEYHARTVAAVKDASAVSPNPGEVVVTVLGRDGDGSVSSEVLDDVEDALNAEDVRPLTDQVTVQGPTIIPFTVEAELYLYDGPDSAVVLAAAQSALASYLSARHALGNDIALSGIYAALHQSGVQRVALTSPPANIEVDSNEAAYCAPEDIDISIAGVDE